MNRSFIDDNGNPCDDSPVEEEHVNLSLQAREPDPMYLPEGSGGGIDEPPKYFINAAELSEEDTFVSEQSVSENAGIVESKRSEIKPPVPLTRTRSRVPVSKSYPDIIQTTFNTDEDIKDLQTVLQQNNAGMAKENSDLESLVADSLENLTLQTRESNGGDDKPLKAFDDKPLPIPLPRKGVGTGIMSSSAFMTESQMGGILAEKPPEAWVIDLNSLSMNSEMETSRRGVGSGSNSNSMAFFVNMDAKEDVNAGHESESMSSSMGPDKKIFSMFVDIKDEGATQPSHIPNLKKPVVNKPVLNVMETSTGSIKSNKKFPSPIFQHKAAAEAARQAARSEWEKQREKYFDSLEPSSMMIMIQGGTPSLTATNSSAVTTIDDKETLGESTISNRSSLHVANVLESSFSSSVISSMETSQPGEMEICQGGACFKLQLDLTRMFQEGINTDVNISANGKWIRAHKCILASRSQYFAAILSGHWVEKAGNTINLDGFSYSVVQFALYHIYSGTNEIPDTIDLLELATLTDLLGLEGLRENISQTFRVKFCHNFHRPCTGCITGVLECFPIAVNYGMDELHRKMIKWICKHFVRIWPTKGFASLGEDLIDKCLKYSINHLSVDNILDHTLGCDQLTTTMPSLRWTETIFNIVNQLAEECIQFMGENLSDVLQSQKFLQFGKGQAWNISRIEGTFMHSMTLLKPDIACLSHTALTRLIELGTETIDEVEWSTSFVDFLKTLRDEVEKYLYANASKAVLSKCWEELTPSFRKKICSSSFMGYDKFGNKVVKNTGNPNTTSSASVNKTQKQRPSPNQGPSSSSRSGSGLSSNSKPVATTRTSHPSAKVASVRPMQSHQYTQDEEDTVVQPRPTAASRTVRTLSNVGRSGTMSSTKSDANDCNTNTVRETRSSTATATTVSRNMQRTTGTVDKPSSRRTSMAAASPTHSANRTPIKPLTPSVPSKTLSSFCDYSDVESAASKTSSAKRPSATSATARNHALARQQSKPQPEPPKKTFVTNSAKAAAVSKPILKPIQKKISTPTSSASSVNSFVGGGGCGSHSPSRQSSKPGSGSQASARYLIATHHAPSSTGTFSARSSFSNVERPKTARGEVTKSKVESNPPPRRRNTYGHQTQPHQNQTKVTATQNLGKSNNKRPTSSSAIRTTTTTTVATTVPTRKPARDFASMPPETTEDFPSFSESFQQDSLTMSRSTIETESGDVKMRTLAEIGRSSTFSKDEPTILGKLDGSGYGHIGYEDEDYEDDFEYE